MNAEALPLSPTEWRHLSSHLETVTREVSAMTFIHVDPATRRAIDADVKCLAGQLTQRLQRHILVERPHLAAPLSGWRVAVVDHHFAGTRTLDVYAEDPDGKLWAFGYLADPERRP